VNTKKIKEKLSNKIVLKKIVLIGISYLFILLIFIFSDCLNKGVNIIEGEPAYEYIIAKQHGEYQDTAETERLRELAAQNAGFVYYIDPEVFPSIRTNIHRLFLKIKEIQKNTKISKTEDKVNWLRENLKSIIKQKIPYYTLETLLKADNKDIELIEYACNLIMLHIMELDIKQVQLAEAYKLIEKKSADLPFSEEYLSVIKEIDKSVLLPNCIIDVEETQKIKTMAREKVKPVLISVRAGEIIVERGYIVKSSHLEILSQLGMLDNNLSIKKSFGFTLLILILLFFLILYVYKIQKEDLYSFKNILFYCIIVVSHLSFAILLFKVSGYLVCLPALGMFIAILFDYNLAIVFSVFVTMIFAIFPDNQLNFVMVNLVGCIIATFSVAKITKRFDLTIAGFFVGMTNFITILSISLINYTSFWFILKDCIYGVLGGILSAVLVLGFLPIFERYFDFTPQIRLLELSNQQEPLLQKLLMEAPGTFHHSLIVANLAEKVAQELGANPLLSKVGALYHDIGKTKRPAFFIENQRGENPHDKISPNLSTLIVHSHVKDGLELAQKYKLPEAIQNFIPEHQGTSLAAYFYHKAKQGEYGDSVDENDFRYPGPKPQSKETAILMVSDAVEATSRTLEKPTPIRIQSMVKKIISKCLEDGQFDECGLSFKELSVMADVLTQILTTMYHKRIEYPDAETNKINFDKKQNNFITRNLELKEGK